jgi:superfamily II DNA helicase RecQ
MRSIDLQAPLKQLLGKGATFQGAQESIVTAVIQQRSPIVTIIPTGASKSITFMLPASCSTGVTVVVVPLLSLLEHFKDRCSLARINCVE